MIRQLVFDRYILDFLNEQNIKTDTIVRQIKPLDRLERLHMLACHASEKYPDPLLGLYIGGRASNFSYGILGYALVNAPNLVASHRLMLKHLWILQESPATAAELNLDKTSLGLIYRYPPQWPTIPDFFIDLFFSANLARSRELTGDRLRNAHLRLKRPPPTHADLYRKTLGIEVSFEQSEDQLNIPRDIALAPINTSHLGHSIAYRNHTEAILSKLKKSGGLTDHIRRLILKNRAVPTTMKAVADELGLEIRTLRRRLKSEKTTFREIQQDVLCHLACTYLISTDLSVSDIASLVGYHDTSTFNRAFIGWLGITPPSYRKSHQKTGNPDKPF